MAYIDNPSVHTDQFPPLADATFIHVAPAYRMQLRLHLLPWLVLAGVAWWLAPQAVPNLANEIWIRSIAAAAPAVIVALLMVLWVPRRYAHTGYCVRHQDLHLRMGALWQRTTSVTLNRIQHLEINQGPAERMLGIARLMIFTAGGAGHDLVLPGLPIATAERLKEHLLLRIAPAERAENQPATQSQTATADDNDREVL